MSCSLPHTVEEIKEYVQKQCDIDDAARQKAMNAVSKLFNKEYHVKQALKEQNAACKDIPPERRDVLHDESMKDLEVLNKLEAIRSHFFHGVDPSVRKMMLVKWNNVLASKEMGGLGVSSFYALNRALIFKWVWRLRTQGNSIWTKVIKALHDEEGNLDWPTTAKFPSNWLDIIRSFSNLYNKGVDLLGYIKKKVGNGENTMFWDEL
nr:RNA-directed DNA polymerase, eukaryota [Tanacetum cinerariifolium]